MTANNQTAALYAMLRIRRVEERIAAEYHEQEMRNPVHLCIGQEATAVGLSLHLSSRDKAMSGHRSHAHYLAKGGSLRRMIAELYGRSTGCCRGRGGSQHLIDESVGFVGAAPILATTVPICVGVAWSAKVAQDGTVVVAYFGDGATEEGCVHEALSFASLHQLPILFVCENNGLSTHTLIQERQPDRPLSDIATAHSVKSVVVDGMRVQEISNKAREAIATVRGGAGPILIESRTYRFVGHVGPGNELDMGYRDQSDLDRWPDPISLETARVASSIDDWDTALQSMEDEIAREIDDAFSFAKSSPFPQAEELTADTYPEGA